MEGVGPAEYHANENEENGRLIECLVQADVIVGIILEVLQATLSVFVSVDDPVLRHVPDSL